MAEKKEWILSANLHDYKHADSFTERGYIDWRTQEKESGPKRQFQIGDIVYIYITEPEKRIAYKTIVEDVDIPLSDIKDDSKFWIKPPDPEYSESNLFAKLKNILTINDNRLVYKELLNNGLKERTTNPAIIVNEELSQYINSVLGCDIEDKTYEDLSEDELGKKLREYYDSPDFGKVTGIYLFGIKYGKLIKSKDYSVNGIVVKSGIHKSFNSELYKAINLSKELSEYATILDKNNNSVAVKNAFNIIYYGNPGCGKSYLVNMEYNENEYLVYRTTFHPEYSNTDFVGQIIPKTVNNEIKYEFQEGPFAIALLNAIINPSKKVCLIIEEINRGNASAIFGDIFQLLDRNTDGESIYSIVNGPLKDYLANNGVHVEKIKIPSNLWIVATMNTSDQNVFTLDTAFKRRWRMHRIRNEFDDSNPYDKKLAGMYVPGSSYTWKDFISAINNEIMRRNPTGINSEDKQLGVYFVTENELANEANASSKDHIDKFVEKVLLYIWDDVAKIDPSVWFGDDIKSFDDLVKKYYKKNLKVFRDMFIDQNNNESQPEAFDEESN